MPDFLLKLLTNVGSRRYGDIWPKLLQELHVTKSDVNKIVMRMAKEGHLILDGMHPHERTPKDDTELELPRGR